MPSSSVLQCPPSIICFVFLLSFLICSPNASAVSNPPPSTIKAVNLGGWLNVEGWMTPWLFDNITNKDLLDGTQVQFRSVAQDKYLTAENGGGAAVVATRSNASGWETFKLWRITDSTFQFKVFYSQFIGLDNQGQGGVVAETTSPSNGETFEIVRNSGDGNRIRLRSLSNSLFLQAKTDGSVTADGQDNTTWGNDDPSVFMMSIISTMQGEFQLTNGYGKDEATAVLRNHWNNYIEESDFSFMFQHGINAVRIPVGYWIVNGSNPPWPFIGGGLAILDNAFTWAGNNGIKVIIDLHAVPGSQNGNDHSGSRDGSIGWGTTQDSIDQTVVAIDFLANRYANLSNFLAMELINEPHSPEVSLDTLKTYYKSGYDAVRKYSPDCYVIMSNRLGSGVNPTELLGFATGFGNSVIDVHYYNVYGDYFNKMSVQGNIDYVNNQRAAEIGSLTQSNGPLIFVGEWTAELTGANDTDAQRFGAAELAVFGRASFGWAYWSFRNVNPHWSMEYMLIHNLIVLNN